jgi:hypothetical protein
LSDALPDSAARPNLTALKSPCQPSFAGEPMTDTDSLKQLAQLAAYNTIWSDRARQMNLLRYWADELAEPRNADPKRLLRYGFKLYSQNDEDGIIQEIFKRVGVTNRCFVEFGVESGLECNSVKLLVEGWRGLWLDSSAAHVAQIRTHFKTFVDDGRLTANECFVSAENINTSLEQGGANGEIDFLSIDIDNNDYWVWKAIDTVNPRVVAIEYNASLRPPLSLVIPYEPTRAWDYSSNYFGASLEALVRLGRSKGYRLVGCNFSGANAFFVRDDIAGDFFLDPATAEEHYEPPRYFFSLLKPGHQPKPGVYVPV